MRLVKGLLERCAEVMERMAASPAALGVSEIAAALDLPKSAAHRLLQELVRLGWAEQDAEGRYRASLRFGLLGSRVMQQAGLPNLAQPLLDRLARECRELVRLTVANGRGLTWVAYAQGAPAGLVYQPEMAGPVVLHATANGKAYLATLDAAAALDLAVAEGLGQVQPTGRTLATRDAFAAELSRVRAQGFAVSCGEAEIGVVAVAVAIGVAGLPASGTLSVAGPMLRMAPERYPALASALRETAVALAVLRPFQIRSDLSCASN